MIQSTKAALRYSNWTYSLAGLFLFQMLMLTGCYSLKGYSIDPAVESYYVGNFKLLASNAPATITQTFSEALKDKISRESRLEYTDEAPDLEFNGSVQGFNVMAVAPKPGERTSFNRLTITVTIDYTNNLDPKGNWSRNFSHFEDFPAEENLSAVQEDLITIIFNQILEDIFNQAFNNW